MTVKQWDFPIIHITDADFRAWGSDLSVSLGQVGLVQTADTGQINWTTVLKPTVVSTYAGYEIWRFPDSSLFMKWEYGNGNGTGMPAIRVQVGTGSNGAGTLTGSTSSIITISNVSATNPNGSSRRSYLSRDPNNSFFGFSGYVNVTDPDSVTVGLASGAIMFFCVSRTVNANTIPTTQGYAVYARATGNTTTATQCQGVDIANNISTSLTTAKAFCYAPFTITSSTIGAVPQFFTHFLPLATTVPTVAPQFGVCTVLTSEIASGVTFQANPIGATPRTFIGVSASGVSGAVNDPNTGSTTPIYRLAMLWE